LKERITNALKTGRSDKEKKLDIENGTFIRSKEIWEEYLRSLSKREGIVDEKTMGINKKRKE
jgi:hypothetical protein